MTWAKATVPAAILTAALFVFSLATDVIVQAVGDPITKDDLKEESVDE